MPELRIELETNLREDFTIMEKTPTRAFSWLKAPTGVFSFKTLLRHCAKQGAFSVIVQLQTSRRFVFSSNLEPELRSSITLGTGDMETLIFKELS